MDIIWHFGGDRQKKGQWRRGRGGDGDKIVGMGWGQNILPCQSLVQTDSCTAQVVWLGLRVGGRLAPFYIYQINRVNSRNGFSMMVAP